MSGSDNPPPATSVTALVVSFLVLAAVVCVVFVTAPSPSADGPPPAVKVRG
jgi:hypothetical protein